LIDQADGLLIAAGAGMRVDSGRPDFRGQEGFWQAYPALRQAGMEFSSITSPEIVVDILADGGRWRGV
jgi:NAD-dependent SIR2 family protein deacetylase